VARDLLRDGREGRFFRGNLHCHSNRSDGLREPEEVVGAYRNSGYDYICLSDHFEEEYGWQITDPRSLRDENFTTILGAKLSSAPWEQCDCYWVTAAGLPQDFGEPPADDHAEAIRRAAGAGRRACDRGLQPQRGDGRHTRQGERRLHARATKAPSWRRGTTTSGFDSSRT
jgi:hypothetical protein